MKTYKNITKIVLGKISPHVNNNVPGFARKIEFFTEGERYEIALFSSDKNVLLLCDAATCPLNPQVVPASSCVTGETGNE